MLFTVSTLTEHENQFDINCLIGNYPFPPLSPTLILLLVRFKLNAFPYFDFLVSFHHFYSPSNFEAQFGFLSLYMIPAFCNLPPITMNHPFFKKYLF